MCVGIRYLDKLLEKEESSRVKFLQKFPDILHLFDVQTLRRKVIPPILLQMKDERFRMHTIPVLLKLTEVNF